MIKTSRYCDLNIILQSITDSDTDDNRMYIYYRFTTLVYTTCYTYYILDAMLHL